jgi:hypothetical protein
MDTSLLDAERLEIATLLEQRFIIAVQAFLY